jgi:hypothetical protein
VRLYSVVRSLVTPAFVVGLGAVACGGGGGGTSSTPIAVKGPVQHPSKLLADVGHGDAFEISLKDPAGNPITNLAAGTYTLQVNDESTIHDFHLTGAGVDDSTGVGSTGTKTFSVTFKPGTYTFQCDAHPGSMHGTFTVS